ncbi:IS66 Orf2 like protein [Rhizobium tibeticum]|uniref:IS66 Orf2 like protein n=1 Tax=Rhizobium tibeticum TaxID=501024 RepID=A0ABY1AZA8_9HYPH|nr:IS66 family insertion sequence element accessory protein TnpB [Rhizobium tibeticum]SEP37890.1 IS66 Orf2 like protein [Rhizobium tibeticum]
MFRLAADLKVYLHREPIDFRAGINSLAVLVQKTMELDPFAPAVFAFCNRRRDRMLTSCAAKAPWKARRRYPGCPDVYLASPAGLGCAS